MASDIILDIDGVTGESADDKHSGKIDVLAFSWGISNPGSFHQGGGGGVAKADFADLTITKHIDAATPTLMLYCSNGKHFDSAKLIVRKAGGDKIEFLVFTLSKVMVSGYSTGGSDGTNLTENIKLNFSKVHVDYTQQSADGSAGTKYPYTWDIAKGTSGS